MAEIKKKIIKGVVWSSTGKIIQQISNFIITVILARLLSPNDFGLMSMAVVVTGLATIFCQMGLTEALIQKQDMKKKFLSSVFWFCLFIGISITLITIFCSHMIAKFYANAKIEMILRVLSIQFPLTAMALVPNALLSKNLKFKQLSLTTVISFVLSGCIGIICAFNGFGVWSIVFQMLSSSLLTMILLLIYSSWHPQFFFSLNDIKILFPISKDITCFKIVNFIARNVDYLLIGKFLGTEALGYYTIAYKLMLTPLKNVSGVISSVMFPALSKVQDNIPKVKRGYLKMVKGTSFLTFPILIFIFVMAPEITRIFLGQKWISAINVIRILSLCGIIQSVGSPIGIVRLSQGKSGLHLFLGILNAVFVFVIIALSLSKGIYAIALSYTIFSWIWFHFSIHVSLKIIDLSLKDFISQLKLSYAISALLFVFILGLKHICNSFTDIPKMMILLTIGGIFYVVLLFLTQQLAFNKNGKIRFHILK